MQDKEQIRMRKQLGYQFWSNEGKHAFLFQFKIIWINSSAVCVCAHMCGAVADGVVVVVSLSMCNMLCVCVYVL